MRRSEMRMSVKIHRSQSMPNTVIISANVGYSRLNRLMDLAYIPFIFAYRSRQYSTLMVISTGLDEAEE
jgi:hypothetical protein